MDHSFLIAENMVLDFRAVAWMTRDGGRVTITFAGNSTPLVLHHPEAGRVVFDAYTAWALPRNVADGPQPVR
jgi:hypothetical protein